VSARDEGPIEERYRDQMLAIAKTLDGFLNDGREEKAPRKTGFVLMVFPFGEVEGGRTNYISNGASREDMVKLMKELIVRFEGKGFSVRNRQ
jgi:hypothetical protein